MVLMTTFKREVAAPEYVGNGEPWARGPVLRLLHALANKIYDGGSACAFLASSALCGAFSRPVVCNTVGLAQRAFSEKRALANANPQTPDPMLVK